jgi:2-polyprenyl-3-methyl-5-hydroxy-6-metoxy-1,4-benzoquinol methylase
MSENPHSEAYFGDTRDFWWHQDFLQLMATRWQLSETPEILDVGCGVGHWGRALLSVRPQGRVTGFDREPQWVAEATRRGAHLPCRYQLGDVTDFQLERQFDVVTCHTLLIHLKSPQEALQRMLEHVRLGQRLAHGGGAEQFVLGLALGKISL